MLLSPQTTDYLDQFLVRCRFCDAKAIDPERKHNQVYIQGMCASCNQHSADYKRWEKQQRKLQKAAEKQAKQAQKQQGRPSLISRIGDHIYL